MCVPIRRGIKKGCSATGSVSALLFHCMLRRLVAALPAVGYSVMCNGDEWAASMLDVRVGLSEIMPILLDINLATGRAIHPEKTEVINYGGMPHVVVKRLLQEVQGAGGLEEVSSRTYLAVVIGPSTQASEWDKTVSKFRSRMAYVCVCVCVP